MDAAGLYGLYARLEGIGAALLELLQDEELVKEKGLLRRVEQQVYALRAVVADLSAAAHVEAQQAVWDGVERRKPAEERADNATEA